VVAQGGVGETVVPSAGLLGRRSLAGGAFVQLMKPLVNDGFVDPKPDMAVLLPLAIVGLFVLRGFATFVTDYGMALAGRSVVRDLREQILGKYLRLPSSHFDVESVPAMVSRLNFDTEQVTQAGTDAVKTIVTDGLTIAYLLAIMLWVSAKVTLAMVLITPLIGVLVWYVGKRYRKISRGIQDGMGQLAQSAEQSLAAQQDVKVYGAQAFEQSRYSTLVNRMLRLNMKVESTRAGSSALVQMLKDEAKKQGKPFGLLFDNIEGGFTVTGRSNPNAFNVMPNVVYRIYTDDRAPELVRGVDLIGTPLAAFAKIIAASDRVGIFNGICGAESGSVPVSASSPELLVSEVEVQKKAQSQEALPILPAQ
jgi:ABC-type multidrug transport system fused ATPase/permease subunit